VDQRDFALLQAMGFQPYLDIPPVDAVRPARLAKRVGLGLKATKERIAQLEAAGVIAGYDAYPNLGHFPFSWKSFHFRVPEERKPAFLGGLEPVEGLVGSFNFLGRDVCIDVFAQDEAEMRRRVRLLSQMAGVEPWEFYANAVPPVRHALSLLDWRIVKALRHDAKRPLPDIARELKVTPRTVKNRFDRMVAEQSLWIVPRVDFSKISGFVPFGVLIYSDRPNDARKVIEPNALYSWTPPDAHLGQVCAFMQARTMGEVEECRRRVLAVPGVTRVELLVPTGIQMSLAWLDEAIERRIAELSRISIGGPPTPADGKDAPVAFRPKPRGERQPGKR
jgi:DNA-binding Lrp family transcriptional regulator